MQFTTLNKINLKEIIFIIFTFLPTLMLTKHTTIIAILFFSWLILRYSKYVFKYIYIY